MESLDFCLRNLTVKEKLDYFSERREECLGPDKIVCLNAGGLEPSYTEGVWTNAPSTLLRPH